MLAFTAVNASGAVSAELKRYPYLTDVVGDAATVNWGTTRLSNQGVLKYGKVGAEACNAHTVATTRIAITVGSVAQFQWKAQLTGLEPNTEYCYRIYMTASSIDLLGDDPSPHFKSQIPQGSSDPYSFAVFGDWGYVHPDGTNPDQANVMRQIAQSGASDRTTYQSAVASQGSCSVTNRVVTCSLGSLASGSSGSITIRLNATKDGKADNSVNVSRNESDPVGGNNKANANIDIKK